jgi:hypothetical protein
LMPLHGVIFTLWAVWCLAEVTALQESSAEMSLDKAEFFHGGEVAMLQEQEGATSKSKKGDIFDMLASKRTSSSGLEGASARSRLAMIQNLNRRVAERQKARRQSLHTRSQATQRAWVQQDTLGEDSQDNMKSLISRSSNALDTGEDKGLFKSPGDSDSDASEESMELQAATATVDLNTADEHAIEAQKLMLSKLKLKQSQIHRARRAAEKSTMQTVSNLCLGKAITMPSKRRRRHPKKRKN